jgi:hypothetical protein
MGSPSTRSITLAGRTLTVELSRAARAALARRTAPLVAEMELYFSCLIRKRVRFPERAHPDALFASLDPMLTICFRPVMTRACAVSDVDDHPDLEAFPIQRVAAFVPRHLRLDYRHGNWSGGFRL